MNWTTDNIPDQQNKTALVTGANSGIGYEIAKALYQKGAHVILASREIERAAEAILTIKADGGSGSLEMERLDLSSLKQVHEFATAIKQRHQKIDVLINNAGIMTPPAGLSEDGFEQQFAVNLLGHFALTGLLYPLLRKSKAARVVTMSSGAYKMVKQLDFENLRLEKVYDAQREYAMSKLADLLFMTELQKRSTVFGDNIISSAAHPGVTESRLARHMDKAVFDAAVEQYGALMPSWQGALPALYAATAGDVKGGDYYGPDGEYELRGYPALAELTDAAKDGYQAEKLWQFAAEVTGLNYP